MARINNREKQAFTITIILVLIASAAVIAFFTTSLGQITQTALTFNSEVPDFTYIYKASDLQSSTPRYSSSLRSSDAVLSVDQLSNEFFNNPSRNDVTVDYSGKKYNIKVNEKIKLDDFISIKLTQVQFGRTSSSSYCPQNKTSTSGIYQGCATEEIIIPGDLTYYNLNFDIYVNTEDFINVEYPNKDNVARWKGSFTDEAVSINSYTQRLDGELNLNIESVSLFKGVDNQRVKIDMPVGNSGRVRFDIPSTELGIVKTSINPVIIFKYDNEKKEAISTKAAVKLLDVRPQIIGEDFTTFDQKIADRTAQESVVLLPSQEKVTTSTQTEKTQEPVKETPYKNDYKGFWAILIIIVVIFIAVGVGITLKLKN